MTGRDPDSPFATFHIGNNGEPELLQADPRLDGLALTCMAEYARQQVADSPSRQHLRMMIVSWDEASGEAGIAEPG